MQRSFEELGTPLSEVTFCVVDLETTGGSPANAEITEVGAVKLRGGHCLGTLQTLVNPGTSIPPAITILTGITEAMVVPAPYIDEVLPSLLEFLGDSVIVGHNVRFDLGFLQAALARTARPSLSNRSVDTCALARRLLAGEVPNCRLGTLASRLRLPHSPTHRALDDALATGDLLHLLLERAGTLGVLGLDDLLTLPSIRAHPSASKLKLTTGLPRSPGVYLFRGSGGRVLYVGKATNLRARVRSYFSGDSRRKVGALLRELETIDHLPCAGPLESAVLEIRLIHEHQPPFNRTSKGWRRYAYLKLTLDERFPRFSVVRSPRAGDGCFYLGPLPSAAAAREVAEAVETVIPLRRCRQAPPRVPKSGPCAAAQLGVATCPCAGGVSESEYAGVVRRVVEGLTTSPETLFDPLAARMRALAAAQRFEEAAATRDRAAALARALHRQRRIDGLRRAGRVQLDLPRGGTAEFTEGRLADTSLPRPRWHRSSGDGADDRAEDPAEVPVEGPVPRHLVDELTCVARWLESSAPSVRLVHCEGELASPLPKLPSFVPGKSGRG